MNACRNFRLFALGVFPAFSCLFAVAILAASGRASAQTLSNLRDKTRAVEDALDANGNCLTTEQRTRAGAALDQALAAISGSGSTNLYCAQSSSNPGKACFKSPATGSTCQGNYFANPQNCADAKAAIRQNTTCFESEVNAGKAYIAVVQETTSAIQNYFQSFAACLDSMHHSSGDLVCFPSDAQPGRFFIGDLSNSGDRVGAYYDSQAACMAAL